MCMCDHIAVLFPVVYRNANCVSNEELKFLDACGVLAD